MVQQVCNEGSAQTSISLTKQVSNPKSPFLLVLDVVFFWFWLLKDLLQLGTNPRL